MLSSQSPRFFAALFVGAVVSGGVIRPASAQNQIPAAEPTSLTVVVKDAESGEAISQARLTLQFEEPGGKARLRVPKKLSYNAKTNAQGRYRFTNIYKGPIHLIVTADRHQSYGKEFELDHDNQVIEVKLKKPQPLL